MAQMTSAPVKKPKVILTRDVRLTTVQEDYAEEPDLRHLQYRQRLVMGNGNLFPRILFVKAAPTPLDVRVGRATYGSTLPYVQLLRSVGLNPGDAYFTHMVKYGLPNGRLPRSSEVESAGPYIRREIDILRPDVIVPLGVQVSEWFLPGKRMANSRGNVHRPSRNGPSIVPIFDPEIIIIDPRNRGLVFGDFGLIKELI